MVNAASLRIAWVDSSPTGTINLGDGVNFSGGASINDGGTSGLLKVNTWDVRNNRNYTLNFMGGTLKGYDEFAFDLNLRPDENGAGQAMWITSPERAQVLWMPIYVTDRKAEKW